MSTLSRLQLPSQRLPQRAPWACALLAACLASACAAVPEPPATPAVEVAPGVYVVRGGGGEVGPANRGRVGNAGFIVGPQGVIVIDSGTSYREGAALLRTIARVTDRPVRLLLLTHARQEFVFGAVAFQERGIPVQMHAQAAALMAARCGRCLKTLKLVLGDDEMRSTELVRPDGALAPPQTLTVAGRPVRVFAFGHSSGPGDVVVLDDTTGVLFAGGLLDQGRIPDVQDSDLPGWHRALGGLRALPLRTIVPGHGPVAGPGLIATLERYLTRLEARARELLEADAALSEVPDRLDPAEFRDWDQAQTTHRRNASVVFLRLEQEQLLRQPEQP
jgi:glyoxylase-like metal-dependent hydrolase (beta-lactamase superfamily II)